MTASPEIQELVIITGASTGIGAATARELEQSQRYGGLVQAIIAQTAYHTKSGLPADAAARVIAKAVTARKARTRYTVGRDAALLTLVRILPDRILDLLFATALRPHFPKESNEHHDSAAARRQATPL